MGSEFSKLDMNKAVKITLTIYFASSLILLLFVFELLVPTIEAKLIGERAVRRIMENWSGLWMSVRRQGYTRK